MSIKQSFLLKMNSLNDKVLNFILILFFLFNFIISIGASKIGIPKSEEFQTSISFIFLYIFPIYLSFFFSFKNKKYKLVYRTIGYVLLMQLIIVVLNRWTPLDWTPPFMFLLVIGSVFFHIVFFVIEKINNYIWMKIKQ